ncbi:MAG: hypothetical protein WC070_01300 [Candidatus Magasanikbacteria bacterium]
MSINKILNHHKFHKQLKHKIKKTQSFFSGFFNSKKTRRDFSWQGREVVNPFIHENSKKGLYIKIAIIICSFVTIFLILIFHSFFKINDIEIEGLQRIKKMEFEDTVKGIMNYKTFGFISQDSYLLANLEEMKDILKERYPIEKIVIKKTFPNKLFIIIQEKISTIIYDNGKEYVYLDLNGKVVEIMRKVSDYEWKNITQNVVTSTSDGTTSTIDIVVGKIHEPDINAIKKDLGNYPIIYDKSHIEDIQINSVVLKKEHVANIIYWFKSFETNSKLPLKYFLLEENKQDLIIKTFKASFVKTKIDNNVDEQIFILDKLFKERLKNDSNFNYIDLRYSDRIYWR